MKFLGPRGPEPPDPIYWFKKQRDADQQFRLVGIARTAADLDKARCLTLQLDGGAKTGRPSVGTVSRVTKRLAKASLTELEIVALLPATFSELSNPYR